MFLVNKSENKAEPLIQRTFSELSFTERGHLQEWIDKNPQILGENLLIIQKEFDGFSDTYERLDLLALDEEGRLVVIENKLDDSGKDVVWQSLKYVSYCASLSKSEIKDIYQKYLDKYHGGGDAASRIAEFMDCSDFGEVDINSSDSDQRIILVAANFRKEVTSTVLWLQKHNLNIKCIRIAAYQRENDIFVDTEQLLPPPNTEDYQIRLGLKKQEASVSKEESAERYKLRRAFWTEAIPQLASKAGIYQNVSPTKDNWIVGASGHSGIGFNSVILLNGVRAEIMIAKSSANENKAIFNELLALREQLEKEYGRALDWDILENKVASRISISMGDVNLHDKDDWQKIIDFLVENISKLVQVFKKPLSRAVQKVIQKGQQGEE